MRNETVTMDFESRMLGYVEVVYAVALRLTADPSRANALARETMVKAWSVRERLEDAPYPKAWLLKTLREIFVKKYQESGEKRRSLGQRGLCAEALGIRVN